ncbi:hypothetical protein AB6A40_009402 [Gnathostoma spinigerum]|uniref:Uncharacterized protein n=1 Tax=Gnathostoma spinigerum TaxID=75299 RepID=A0ABD6EZU3_9BILA
MAAPLPYRLPSNTQNIGNFPPPLYYRDTYGLQHLSEPSTQPAHLRFTDSVTTVESDDTATTKSTVRTTVNIQNSNLMLESSTSKGTGMTQSYHVEQMITNQVFLTHVRTLLTLTLVSAGSAIQLLVFTVICVFYDGCPYYAAVVASFFFILNSLVVLYFIRYHPMRYLLIICSFCSFVSFLVSIVLFVWTSYLIYGEDDRIRGKTSHFVEGSMLESNRIVTNTRIAMYSLHMVLAPIEAVCSAAMLYILLKNWKILREGKVTHGYFFSQPPIGHQTVLVPIELRQVDRLDESEPENASIGVQTSGNHSNKDSAWT